MYKGSNAEIVWMEIQQLRFFPEILTHFHRGTILYWLFSYLFERKREPTCNQTCDGDKIRCKHQWLLSQMSLNSTWPRSLTPWPSVVSVGCNLIRIMLYLKIFNTEAQTLVGFCVSAQTEDRKTKWPVPTPTHVSLLKTDKSETV